MSTDRQTSEKVFPATHRAVKACALWLSFCLSIGWPREQLDALERLWWQHHDRNGNIV